MQEASKNEGNAARSWSLVIRHQPSGWTVEVYGTNGQLRHLANAESEMEALRRARTLAGIYQVHGHALVVSQRGETHYPLA